jgi:hypothetical protein
MDARRQAIAYLQAALANTLDLRDFDTFVSNMRGDESPLIKEAMHELGHFFVDCDIRKSDADYDRMFREKIQAYIDGLETLR